MLKSYTELPRSPVTSAPLGAQSFYRYTELFPSGAQGFFPPVHRAFTGTQSFFPWCTELLPVHRAFSLGAQSFLPPVHRAFTLRHTRLITPATSKPPHDTQSFYRYTELCFRVWKLMFYQ